MPETEVFFFAEDDGSAPFLKWLDTLPEKDQDKIIVKIERLTFLGHELRRPEADFLRNGIRELRISHRKINYRILYFFSGENQAVISHGLTKKSRVPQNEIDLAVYRKALFKENPEKRRYKE
jgi:phage-related protein